MNAKKKNKKSNKPPNPNPPQNVENVSNKQKKMEELADRELKEKVLPSEIRSEISALPVIGIKETESETPKKPKRNKGKNKKQDKDENIEVEEKIQEIPTEIFAKVEEPLKKIVIEDKEYEAKEDPLGDLNVLPSARKKKNKNKTQEISIEELKTSVDDNNTTVLKEQAMPPLETIDTEIQELFSSKPETSKQEAKKRKNKKKNRTDSERSDKSDNVLSCTSASKNIVPEYASTLEQSGTKVEDKDLTTNLKLELETGKAESTAMSAIDTKIKDTNVATEDKELSKNENKGKKKNKKDKKQQQIETIEAPKREIPEEMSILAENVLPQTIFPDETKEDVTKFVLTPSDTQKEKEPSPKLKAKIAKPVEKKRKGKQETGSSENLLNIESSEIIRKDKEFEDMFKETQPKSEETPTVDVIESQVEDHIKQQLPAAPSPIENINVASDNVMGKKRKKSPKPNKNIESNVKFNTELEPEKIKFEVLPETKEYTEQPERQFVTSESIKIPLKTPDAIPEEILQLQNEPTIDLPQTKSLEIPVMPEIIKDNEGFETKTSKKKKKTPKVPQAETTLEVKEPIVDITKNEDKKEDNEKSKNNCEEQASLPLEPYLALHIPAQRLETGSVASSCDVIPDVHFMRSSSQHLLDSNNNTVIQEVMNVEEIKLNDPQLMPLIVGSGETPASTPEPVSSGIRVVEIEAKTPIEEKTDIKSKIIEVNQDMEELRLSIERSLAEFTALEKSETVPEKISNTSLEKEKSPDNTRDIKCRQNKMSDAKENVLETVEIKESENISSILRGEIFKPVETAPVCPARKDNKGKNKSKKKGKQDITTTVATTTTSESSTSQSTSQSVTDNAKEEKKEKPEEKSEQSSQEKGKQQSTNAKDSEDAATSKYPYDENHPIHSELNPDTTHQTDFEPIENFEDALTSSIDDVNKTFEIIAKDASDDNIEFQKKLAINKPAINITTAEETDTKRNEKVNPVVSQPKNLLGHTDIPVQSNKADYKKEKNKTPNARQARVKIKDSMDIESIKQSKESQTDNKRSRKISDKSVKESFSRVKNDNEEYVYKYSFRKVFLQSACHVCNKSLSQVRVPCGYCNLVFYCGARHKDEDWPQHQALCFAVSTLAHMKDQKHIYADAANISGQDYRLLRMQMIVSCEKVLKRRLVPWEQEVMLYPRMCANLACREWRQGKLKDCDGCGQLSFCTAHPDHLPKIHSRWCKSYSLYQKLVSYQQTKGRLEPRLPTKVMPEDNMSGKMNEVLAAIYEEKIDMNDIQYASLTQMATAPLTTAYCLQLSRTAPGITNGVHTKQPFTIHVVGAELQFEADALNKWETFFLHLRPDVEELRVVLVSPQLNPGKLPLDLLGRIKLCHTCQQNKRRVVFKFEDNKNYFEYRSSEDFINPDIICAFNPSIQRSSIFDGKDPWPASINTILKLKTPFIITSYTLNELRKDIARIKQVSEIDFKLISEPGFNNFASVRPDRNFISDDEMPLLFKNYCVAVVLGC